MEELLAEQIKLQSDGGYAPALDDVEKALMLLQAAREAIQTGTPSCGSSFRYLEP